MKNPEATLSNGTIVRAIIEDESFVVMTDQLVLFADNVEPTVGTYYHDNKLAIYSGGHFIGRVLNLNEADMTAVKELKEAMA